MDSEGIFRMICDINGIELPDRILLTSTHSTEPNTNGKATTVPDWVIKLNEMDAFVEGAPSILNERTIWPDQGLAECWPRDKEIKLQRIYYARIVGEHERPLLGIRLQFTNKIKSAPIMCQLLQEEEYKERVHWEACDTDFSKH